MTFNEGVRIDTSRTSTSGGGGGFPGGGGGIAVGGGMVGLIVLLLTLFLGGDPGSVLSQQAIQPQGGVDAPGFDLSQCRTGKDANEKIECRMVATGNSVDGVWSQLMKGYTPPHMKLFKGQTDTGCGPATSDVGPFYCPGDQKVYIDLAFYQELKTRFRAPGDFAQAYVIAHEVGHHVQNLLGISAKVQAARERAGEREANALSVRLELQADCLAGVWAHNADASRHILEAGDVEEALTAASAIGDDTLQKQAQGYAVPDSFTHGSAAQRTRWFKAGMEAGKLGACNTFQAKSL